MEALCRGYWYPIYAHIRRRGHGIEDARDLTQEFFASLVRHESLSTVRRERGRFRTFLLTALDYFLSDQRDRAQAQKRGSGIAPIELDSLEGEQRLAMEPVSQEETPDLAFDRRWISVLVEKALGALAHEFAAAGKSHVFIALKPFLEHPTSPGEYERLGPSLGMTPNAIAASVRRLRLRLRELLLSEVSHTVGTPNEAEAELRSLFS